jgi:asparaginyl-tRNA synthetase
MDLEATSLIGLYRLHEEDPAKLSEKTTTFYGWIRRTRVGGGGAIVFVDVYDGTKVGNLNCLCSEQGYSPAPEGEESAGAYRVLTFEQLSQAEQLSPGCAVEVQGKLTLSPPNATQLFELQATRVSLIGGVQDHINYPITKSTEKKLTSLRQLPFFRFRSQAMQCIFRVRSKLNLAVHLFMDSEDVQLTDPNIMTVSDCEGAGETFQVSPHLFSKDKDGNELPVGLTVSSQLPLEATILGFKQVYTCQKSFRAEKSDTNKHLAEFLHVEYEGAFIDLDGLMAQAERFVKYVINFGMERCKEDLTWLEGRFAPTDIKPTRTMLLEALQRPFVRIKHRDAIDLIHKLIKGKAQLPGDDGKLKRVKVKEFPSHGEDLGAEHEKLLVNYFGYMAIPEDQREEYIKAGKEFGAFVFVTHWPHAIKSFYMAQTDDDSGECASFDLLCPRVGELFGGSMREWRFDKLDAEVQKRGMDISPIQWYIDLRKTGSMPHGGWGMGFDRLVMLVCGVQSVRDVVPFPVYYTHCPY